MDTAQHNLFLRPTMRWQVLWTISWQPCLSAETRSLLDSRGLWGAACISLKPSAGNSSTLQCNGKLLFPSPGPRRMQTFTICQRCASVAFEYFFHMQHVSR